MSLRHPPPRTLHPIAWWTWGALVGAAAVRITNPLLVALLVAATALVVAARSQDRPWAKSYSRALRLGGVVVVVRIVLVALFAPRVPGHVLVTLPSMSLGSWAAGLDLGGPVTREAIVGGTYESLRLVGLLSAVAAASSLADPSRLLRALPGALHEAGVAVTVALSLVPQAGEAAAQVRDARRLRGRPTRGWSAVRGVAVPVLEGALQRSVSMAASMDARGFARREEPAPTDAGAGAASRSRGRRRWAPFAAIAAFGLGVDGMLDHATPAWMGPAGMIAGGALVARSLRSGPASVRRTRYRPDRWRAAEAVTVASGAFALALLVLAGRLGVSVTANASHWPPLPALPALACLCAAVPAFATPEPPP